MQDLTLEDQELIDLLRQAGFGDLLAAIHADDAFTQGTQGRPSRLNKLALSRHLGTTQQAINKRLALAKDVLEGTTSIPLVQRLPAPIPEENDDNVEIGAIAEAIGAELFFWWMDRGSGR